MEKLDGQGSTPLYYQLYLILRDKIASGEYAPGTRIPTENELIRTYGVSRITVRNAINQLANERMLVKTAGKGTFVSMPKIERSMDGSRVWGFSESVKRDGETPSAKLISVSYGQATEEEAVFFGVTKGSPLIYLKRLRLINGIPALIELNTLPSHYSVLLSENLEQSLYELMRTRLNVRPAKGKKTFEIAYATNEEAVYLECSPGSPVMLSYETCIDSKGMPCHMCKQIIHGKRFRYVLFT